MIEELYTDEFRPFLRKKGMTVLMFVFGIGGFIFTGALFYMVFIEPEEWSWFFVLIMSPVLLVFTLVPFLLVWVGLAYMRDARSGRVKRREIEVLRIGNPSKYGRPLFFRYQGKELNYSIPPGYAWSLDQVQLPQKARMWTTYYGNRLLRLEFLSDGRTFCVLD